MSIRKKFDQALFDKYDEAGKQKVSDYMEWQWECTVKEASKYGIDLVATVKGKPVCYTEVEVRNWGDAFRYQTIHVPQRKAKYLKNDITTIFFAVSSTLKYGYWCHADKILSSPLMEVPNKEISKGEFFYNVPISNFNYVRFIV